MCGSLPASFFILPSFSIRPPTNVTVVCSAAHVLWLAHMLQSNKVKTLLEAVPNLALLETVDSAKLASKLDSTGQYRCLAGGQQGGRARRGSAPRAGT
jgi:hypothetical protein